jgi:murein DD-endopeptidase MepM/ murein hydrolase activator NlpD
VADGRYQSEEINVPDDQLALLDPNLNSAETALLTRTMTNFTDQRYFDGPLGLPAAAPVSSPFGTRRSYNGGPYDRFHTGTDFAGPPGSPIYAPADGIVVMVDTLNIYGNFTVIDHGWGVFSAYAHQTETYVVVGQTVSAGEVIGTIGNTGRSIGPHLHWELWVNGVETDAIQWTRYNFAE